MNPHHRLAAALLTAASAFALAVPAAAQTETGSGALPEWLDVSGSVRARYESLSGQYRTGASESDQLLSLRTTLAVEASRDDLRAGFEIFDSRGYLTDNGSVAGTGEINVLEPVQAYIGFTSGETDVTLGRFTLDLGSRRLVGRNNFRNTTNAFTGANVVVGGVAGGELTAFYTFPQIRKPDVKADILDNEFEFDAERSDFSFWGLFYERPDIAPDTDAEFYLFGLHEGDDVPGARNRRLYTPGVRVLRAPSAGAVDFEIEAAYQFGEIRQTAALASPDLDVDAQTLHAEIGYTFAAAWSPRIELAYDHASGEEDTADGEWNRFDALFGPRRPDWGPTGIYGAFSRVNISSPGARLEFKPNARTDGFLHYNAVWLASATDRFDRGGAVDPTGATGSFVGHQFEGRVRYWVVPDRLRLDTGAAWLIQGDFLKNAPNAPGNGDTVYGYLDLTWDF